MRLVHRLRVASVVLLSAGTVASAALAVRVGLFWIIDPLNDALVMAAGLLLAGGLVVGALALRPLRGRAFRTAAALAATGAVLGGLVRLVAALPTDTGGVFVPYGPGTPPSISWTLLWWQVAGPVLATTATALLLAALAAAIAGTARAVGRLRPA